MDQGGGIDYFQPRELLEQAPPSRRAAYSDRTAWLMASLARLAYIRFEQGEAEYAHLATALRVAGFELVAVYDAGSTQAYLARRETDRLATLVFRGTESTRLEDIKTDLSVFVTDRSGRRVHSGFLDAFNGVRADIEADLLGLHDYALYICGHSLGGALALVATRELESDQCAACYTFGSPRVGNQEFGSAIKTPVYRVVNTADIVPRLPPGLVIELLVDALRFLQWLLPLLGWFADWLDNRVSGYRHYGDMRYLTHCHVHDCADVELIPNITFLDRWRRLFKSRVSPNRHIADHAIDRYCIKLGAYARKRNR